ncbi:MAG: cation:proton antiporter, partial [Cocleimonas sp.]
MSIIDTIAILISLAAIFSYINYRFLKIPSTIGLLAIALLMSLGIVLLGKMGLPIEDQARELLKGIDFNEALMQGMLSALLFAGALHVHLEELVKQKWVVAILASVGV